MPSPGKKFSTAWTENLQGQEKEDFEMIVRNSTLLLTRLKTILEDNERQVQNSGLSLSDFSDASWSHKQAFRNGQTAVLRKLKELIPF